MKDGSLALLVALSVTALVVLLPASIVENQLPGSFPLLARGRRAAAGRSGRTLMLEVVFVAALIGGGELVLGAALVHPASPPLVRLIAAVQLVVMLLWLRRLARIVVRRRRHELNG